MKRGGAGAVRDPRREAEVVGEVQQLLGGDPQARPRVGVVADHRGVDGHRDPGRFLGVLGVAHPEQESALQEVEHALEDLLLVLRGGAELREVLQAERGLEAGGAVGGDLVDDVLAAGDVVRLVDQQRHPRAFRSGRWTWRCSCACSMRRMNSMQALLFSVPIAPMFASTIRMSRASMISRSGMSVGWLKNRLQRWDAGEAGDLVARRVEPLGDAAGGHAQVVG